MLDDIYLMVLLNILAVLWAILGVLSEAEVFFIPAFLTIALSIYILFKKDT